MSPEALIDIFREALAVIVMMVSAIVLPGLGIGLIVAVFQAATSINEQTLSFLPRLLVTTFWFDVHGTLVSRNPNGFFCRDG